MHSKLGLTRRKLLKLGMITSAAIPLGNEARTPALQGRALPENYEAPGGATVTLRSGLQMFYRESWLGAPWLNGEPVIFLHGAQETGEIWYGWVPQMAQKLRLYRPDLPGYGRSKAPSNFEWSFTNYTQVVADFMDGIGVASAHIIGAKTGGAMAMQFAASYPQRTRTLTVASGPFSSVDPKLATISQKIRLGSSATKEEMDYFDKLISETNPETKAGVRAMDSSFSLDGILPKITAPTLIITSDRSALQSVETVLRSQRKIPNSRLLVLRSDAYHVAVANAEECVTNTLDFIEETRRSV